MLLSPKSVLKIGLEVQLISCWMVDGSSDAICWSSLVSKISWLTELKTFDKFKIIISFNIPGFASLVKSY